MKINNRDVKVLTFLQNNPNSTMEQMAMNVYGAPTPHRVTSSIGKLVKQGRVTKTISKKETVSGRMAACYKLSKPFTIGEH